MLLHKIKRLCKEKGVTLAQMEADLELGKKSASNWSKSKPKADTLVVLADYFGITVDELLRDSTNDDD